MKKGRIGYFVFPLVICGLLVSGCTKKEGTKPAKTTLWVYTSLYNEVIEKLTPVLQQELPDIDVKWFAAGSEKVLAKVNAELASGHVNADLILTSDPFWYEQLAQKGLLLVYESPAAKSISANLKNPENYWVTVRIPVMVIAYNKDVLEPLEVPTSFKDLTSTKWKGKVALGSPLESGTNFTAVANLSQKYGWDYYKQLRANETFSSGGNSTVRQKVESKEYPIGVILLENILQAKSSGSPMQEVYPSDGVVLVPSPIAIFKSSKVPDAAKRFYDFMLSQKGQMGVISGNMYSPLPNFPPPEGAKPFSEVYSTAFQFDYKFVKQVLEEHDKIKQNYSKIMFE